MDIMILDNALDIACEILFDMCVPFLSSQRDVEKQKVAGVDNFRKEIIRKAYCRRAGTTEETPQTDEQRIIIAQMNDYALEKRRTNE